MSEDAGRITLLRQLVDKAGGPLAFARQYSRPDADKPIDETYVSQILNGHRSFGERAARNMEKRAGLGYKYFEQDHPTDSVVPPQDKTFLDALGSGVKEREIPEHIRQTILTLIDSSPKKGAP